MIHVYKDQINKIGLTLSELSVPGDPEEYRFEFTSENSKDVKYSLTLTPTSSTKRLQIFDIEEGEDVIFDLPGFYSYEVYQTAANNLVEVGLLRVIAEEETAQEYISTSKAQVYGGATEIE